MKHYNVRENLSQKDAEKLSDYPSLLAKLLFCRGVRTKAEAEKFLEPDYERDIHDPFLMKDMDKASERILEAICRSQKIMIYGDYDADGIPGAAALADFFQRIGFKNFTVYIPHRHNEGFGLNMEAVASAADGGVELMITVDCGIADVKEAEEAKKRGIDLIITDHHSIDSAKGMPDAYAILDPKRENETYPFKELCGAGVAYKLIQALFLKNDFGLKHGTEKWFLDLVGIATVADMVPLVGENRALAYYGLKVLRKSPRPGLLSLLRKMKIEQRRISEDDIGFSIVPRINAASRMGVSSDAFKMLSTKDDVEAAALSEHLNKINDERKGIVAAIVKEIKKIIGARYTEDSGKKVVVLGNPNWKPALLGLAANSVAEEFKMPVFLWGRDGGSAIKGSCRSDGRADVFKLMQGVSAGMFADFGGHKFSGGFSVPNDKIHFLESELDKSFEKISEGILAEAGEEFFADHRMSVDEFDNKSFELVEKLAPFGTGNPKPVFLFENAPVSAVKNFGKENNHLQISLAKKNGGTVPAIGFFMDAAKFGKEIKAGDEINLVGTLEKSFFRGFPELRIRILDVV